MDKNNQSEIYLNGFRAGYSDLWSQKWAEERNTLPPEELSPADQEEWERGYNHGWSKGYTDYSSYADVVGISANNLIFDSFL
ncbi:MAG: hypothetical protein F6K41_14845 [Symploca sp. SIO3E6]|nr:hypothetical protein [Caldora sp. SIO3E6]